MEEKQNHPLRETFMQREGDALAEWLDKHPRSQLARHVAWFLISRDVIPAVQDTSPVQGEDRSAIHASLADFGGRLREAVKREKAARARVKGPKKKVPPFSFFNPARAYNVRIRLDFRTEVEHPWLGRLILPVGAPGNAILRILPVGSTDNAMLLVIQLGFAGQLHRLRSCAQCKRWLFARRGIQRFCRQSCQKKFFQSRESWKEERKLYMRQYRAAKRESERAALRQAAGTRQKGR
jgi:hypothetical protein